MANAEKRPLKVFLCHASGDKPPVRDLYKHLVAEGVDAWLDKEKLLPGQDWRLEIPRAVQEADVVVVCLSNKSVTKEGYVQKEIKFALDSAEEKPEGTIFLIPARLEDCVVPERLSRWQWVDLYEENGFIQLLRSLKLRADAVGATVVPTAYEDSDKEVERRLDQLYTEGLAAFYTEDWDRACHRFQSILSERPSHKIAIEKLAEAERQRNLAKLYGQSTDAYKSENWQMAIKTLEELSQKSADYKDTAQLLKNARKQKQLKELYAEAKTLHTAQKWQAVVKVFEQISIIDSTYPDPNGLLPSAQKEVAELKRLSDLNDLYSHAVREMDAGQWYEARQLLEQVHKTQTGFLETERLLRKVEDEITKVEEHNQRNNQVNVLYEQAHGLLRSKKWRKALDKMEEIQELDEQFLDKDEISEKAKIELAREEQEAKRQNELAAIYAEAVRLLKEEKYQEALDKWQEVKVVDSKYPDRQWVQRTARKKLAETAKPIQTKPRFVITKSLWMGIVGLLVMGVVVTSMILSGKGNQNVIPTSIVVPTKTAIAIPTRTIIPSKTNTPRSATVVPTTNGYSDPTMYDDFDNAQYNGSYDKLKWGYWTSDGEAPFVQKNGELFVNMGKNNDIDINLKSYDRVTLKKPTFIEARVLLEANANASALLIGFEAISNDKYDGLTACQISNNPGTGKQDLNCSNNYFGQYQEAPLNISGVEPMWHLVRIEIDPVKMQTVFIVDGNIFGPYTLPQADKLKSDIWRFGPSMGRESVKDPPPIAHLDYVRMGAIEDDPTVYDNFDNTAYDGRFDTTKWIYAQSNPNGSAVQQDGSLVFTQSGVKQNQNLISVQQFRLQDTIGFEANLNSNMTRDGWVVMAIEGDTFGYVSCGLHSMSDWLEAVCMTLSGGGGNTIVIKYGIWHVVRIEVDVDKNKITYYIDNKKLTEETCDKSLNGLIVHLNINVSAWENRTNDSKAVTGYIDNVMVYPFDYIQP